MPGWTPFVVTSDARDGSGLLTSSLASHPLIRMFGEVLESAFHPEWEQYASATDLLSTEVYRHLDYYQAIGFKLFSWHGRHPPLDDTRVYLRQLPVHVVHLQRRNLLKKYVSWVLAETSGVWSTRDPHYCSSLTVTLNYEQTRQYFERTTQGYADHCQEFSGLPSQLVYYEDLLTDYRGEMRRLLVFLGVYPDFRVHPPICKQERRSLNEIIQNFDEIKLRFEGSQWAVFFDPVV